MSNVKKLQEAISAGIDNGSPLIFEDLIIPYGLYLENEINIQDPDVKPSGWSWKGDPLYYKISEGKIKVFKNSKIKVPKKVKR